MSELDVRIVKLEPMRVASFLGFGESPEELAFEKLFAWAKPKELLVEPGKNRLFGFNNSNPSKGSPNYGYEVWIVIGPDVAAERDMEIKAFEGGLYAVTQCVVPKGQFEVIGDTWKKLVTWREDSKYKCGNHQWLEESLPMNLPDTEFVLDLYLPISE
ncbi:MAG: GyrI-like domain-containing protein [Chloroflexota bacterium]|nr:GyrI-like domain-containing protein [Chloroflexota bacterium]